MKLKVGNNNLTIRKWKGKDKKNFMSLINGEEVNEHEIMESIVYSCIEEDVVLSVDEFKYVLSRIRAYSLGEGISVEFYCESCGSVFKQDFKLSDVYSYTYTELNEIKVPGYTIKMGDIKNKDFYIEKIKEDSLYDFLLRIESINGDDTYDLEKLEELFDEMDIDILTDILDQYEDARFKLKDINTVKCPSCFKETKYQFDELPGFFPDSWFE